MSITYISGALYLHLMNEILRFLQYVYASYWRDYFSCKNEIFSNKMVFVSKERGELYSLNVFDP